MGWDNQITIITLLHKRKKDWIYDNKKYEIFYMWPYQIGLTYLYATSKWVFDFRKEDIFFCTADIGNHAIN